MSAIRSINIKTLSDVFDSIGSLELVKLLQGLPLAINQAGSYMRETGTTVSKYIDSYNHKWKKLMKDQNYFTLRESADRSVLTTWTVSFDHLREQNEDAANFLKLWAFLDNQDLWYELLTPSLHHEIFDEVPGWFVRCASDELDFKKCMGLLSKYSFINTKFESSSFFMHSVLHHWCLHAFEKENAIMSWLAVVVVVSAVPSQTMPDYSLLQRRLLPHCDRVFSLLEQSIQETFNYKVDIPSVSAACHRLGDLYSDQGKMKEAEDMYLRALTGSEKAWGPVHTSTLDIINNLGILYEIQGKMKEAEDMYLRALTGKEKAWGPAHTSTLRTVGNLGILYSNQGKMKEAEDMYLRALTGSEKAWGPAHTSTLRTVGNLGILYSNQGKMKEAEDMYLRALTGSEKAWGPVHTSTFETVNNLGVLYSDQGKMKEAEDMYLRALTGKEKAWGPAHTSTLNTVNNLGNLYKNQGKMKEAGHMYLRALTGFEQAWGSGHKTPIDVRCNLAFLYKKMAMFKDAAKHFELVVQGYTKILGSDHWKTVDASNQLKSCEVLNEHP